LKISKSIAIHSTRRFLTLSFAIKIADNLNQELFPKAAIRLVFDFLIQQMAIF